MVNWSYCIKIAIITLVCLSLSLTTYAAETATFGITPSKSSTIVPSSAPPLKQSQVPELVPVIRGGTQQAAPAIPEGAVVVAKVVWVKGKLKATTPDKKSRQLSQKADPVFLHDTLETDGSTQAQIVFTDNTLMTFRPNTNFQIDAYKYDPKAPKGQSAGTYIMNLLEGGFRTITGLIAKSNPEDYKINTPVATIGVRGTDYTVVLKDGQLFVGYYKGSPCVSSKDKTLCLDNATPYAKATADAAPVPLTQQPTELGAQQTITDVDFSTIMGGGSGGSGGGTFQGPGGDSITTPSATDVLNSFCIQ